MNAVFVLALSTTVTQAAFSATPSARLQQFQAPGSSAPVLTSAAVLPGYDFHWILDTVNRKITVALVAPTKGWVGLGLGEAGGMRGADIMVGTVDDSTGSAQVRDYHATGSKLPVEDSCQDWSIHYGEQADGKTMIVASRAFTTGDSNDRPLITTGLRKQSLLFAYGSCDTLASCPHSLATGHKKKMFIDLATGDGADMSHFTARLAATSGYSFVDLHFNNASYNANIQGISKPQYKQPDAGGKEILDASTRTMYWEYCFARSEHPEWSAHDAKSLVGFNGILDTSATRDDLVHHSVLYAFTGDDCGGKETIIWVGGNGFFEELPADVGMSFNRFKSFRIQVHYDNPNLEANLKDNSGVRMWLDSGARLHEAGTIQLGDPGVKMTKEANLEIPPGKSYWEFKCPSTITQHWHEITVFGQILHMHENGDQMYLEIKDSSGVVRRPNAVEYFDFGWQDPTLNQPFQIKPGDELTTRCYYNNKNSGNVKFGLGSDEEMCIDFIFYYPYNSSNANLRATQYCGALNLGGSFQKNATVNDNGIALFGVNPTDPNCSGGASTQFQATAAPTKTTGVPTTSTTATPTTAAPVVVPAAAPTHKTTFKSGLGGFTRKSFNAAAQDAYKKVLGSRLAVSPENIVISGIVDATARRRLAASGVTFDVTVSTASTAKANDVAAKASSELTGSATPAFKSDLKAAMVAASGVTFDDSAFDTFDVSSVTGQAVVTEVPAVSTGGSDTNTGVIVGVACGSFVALIGLALFAKKYKAKQQKVEDVVAPASPKDGIQQVL